MNNKLHHTIIGGIDIDHMAESYEACTGKRLDTMKVGKLTSATERTQLLDWCVMNNVKLVVITETNGKTGELVLHEPVSLQ